MAMSPGRTNSPLATHVTLEGLSVIASTPPHFLFSPPDSIPKRGRPKKKPLSQMWGKQNRKVEEVFSSHVGGQGPNQHSGLRELHHRRPHENGFQSRPRLQHYVQCLAESSSLLMSGILQISQYQGTDEREQKASPCELVPMKQSILPIMPPRRKLSSWRHLTFLS